VEMIGTTRSRFLAILTTRLVNSWNEETSESRRLVRRKLPCEFSRLSALNFKILSGRFALIGDFFVFNNLALIQGA